MILFGAECELTPVFDNHKLIIDSMSVFYVLLERSIKNQINITIDGSDIITFDGLRDSKCSYWSWLKVIIIIPLRIILLTRTVDNAAYIYNIKHIDGTASSHMLTLEGILTLSMCSQGKMISYWAICNLKIIYSWSACTNGV